jgi:oxygen-dependent protoporphyrinogen oxidase
MAESVDVAVIGGGIAGLSAARALAKRGVPFVLLESASRFGGVIRTEHADGFLLEAGPDALLAQKPDGVELCRELGLEGRLVSTNPTERSVYVLHGGRLHPLPEGMMLAVPTRLWPLVKSGLFSWPGKLRMGLDLVIPARREDRDESIASFLRRRFGRESVERLGEPLLAGIHAGDPEQLSMRAAFPRLAALEREHGSLIRAFMKSAPRGAAATTPFVSLAGGLSELPEALVASLPAASLRSDTAVRWIHRSGTALAVVLATGETLLARAVVLAVPAPRAAAILEPLAPGPAGFLSEVPFASTATLLFGFRREDVAHPLAGYGFVVPHGEGLRTTAVTFVSSKLPGRAPEGHVLIRAFVGGVRDATSLEQDDATLAGGVLTELAPLLGLEAAPVLRRVYRWPSATPQLEVGHQERFAAVEREVAEVPGLYLAGAGLRVTGIPDCIGDGRRAGEAAAGFVSA